MPEMTPKDMQYEYDWQASSGDNPRLIHEDARHLSLKEGYEMLRFLNNLGLDSDNTRFVYGDGIDLKVEARQRIEWMVKEHFESTAPGRGTVLKWINDNWNALRGKFKAFEEKK